METFAVFPPVRHVNQTVYTFPAALAPVYRRCPLTITRQVPIVVSGSLYRKTPRATYTDKIVGLRREAFGTIPLTAARRGSRPGNVRRVVSRRPKKYRGRYFAVVRYVRNVV